MDRKRGLTMRRYQLFFVAACLGSWPRGAFAAESPPPLGQAPTPVTAPWPEPTGKGVGIGAELGAWGRAFDTGVRFRIPFPFWGGRWGVMLRGLVLSVPGDTGQVPVDMGGRLDLYGQSPVFLNLVRLYGGGGVQTFYEVQGPPRRDVSLGGGGQFGFEFFMSPHYSFWLEVGGSGGRQRFMAGATLLAGIVAYPF
ncbi:MAG: hypothetical protein JW940_10390 [Polyangiaceae bacterium]|nr:hypothetical protein [Polyangiaceae bacterium]